MDDDKMHHHRNDGTHIRNKKQKKSKEWFGEEYTFKIIEDRQGKITA